MSFRIPKTLDFPGGYEATVLVVDRNGTELGGDHGAWDVTNKIVYIAADLTPAEKRGVLYFHEWDHVATDWKLWSAQNIPMKLPEAAEPDPEEREDE